MNELTEQAAGAQPETKRAPVIWRIASVTQEHESVTIVFPVSNEVPEKSENEGGSRVTQE
ncbi:MAG: hypothetical protein AAB542_04090 [Patescibacteria group bacterium]